MFQLPPLEEIEPAELASVKCTKCEKPTPHEYLKIAPRNYDENNVSPLDLLKMTKRLTICTECGTLRLIN